MRKRVLVDTGPIVAFLNRRDRHHVWAKNVLSHVEPPLLTCEAVISEACFLLRRIPQGPERVLELVTRGLIDASFRLRDEAGPIAVVMDRYADLPVSFADACLLRMAETVPDSRVFTCDQHFVIYRIHGRRIVPSILPDDL